MTTALCTSVIDHKRARKCNTPLVALPFPGARVSTPAYVCPNCDRLPRKEGSEYGKADQQAA